jgi:hypothetical protein
MGDECVGPDCRIAPRPMRGDGVLTRPERGLAAVGDEPFDIVAVVCTWSSQERRSVCAMRQTLRRKSCIEHKTSMGPQRPPAAA